MPVYGYRLFVVQLFAGMARTPVDFSQCGGKHYSDIATELLKNMRGETLVQPKRTDLAADVDVVDAEVQTTIDPLAGRKGLAVRVVRQEGDLVYGEALVGTFGDHEAALAAPRRWSRFRSSTSARTPTRTRCCRSSSVRTST